MKKEGKWTLWFVLLLILGDIVLNLYMKYFTLAYALIGVLLLVISGWGAVVQSKNRVHGYMSQVRARSEVEDIERYTR